MADFNKNSFKSYIAVSIVVSFLIGGLSGTFFGIIGGSVIGPQVRDLLGLPANSDNTTSNIKNVLGLLTTNNNSISTSSDKTKVIEEDSATIEVVKKISPSVVSIVATQDLSKLYQGQGFSPFDFFDFGFGRTNPPSGKQEVSSGTGFIISSDGMILTNKHVVSISDAEYTVITNDGKKYDVEILATDPLNDIAILKIKTDNLPVVEMGDSDSIQIGQTAIAIGNTLGEYKNTVTRGVISGIDRTITASGGYGRETLEGVIQTDASINPGNSGGPLLNLEGQVVGINTAIDQQGESIGFAIPINEVKTVIDSVKQNGKVVRPILGIRYILINPALKEQNKLTVDNGALIIKGQNLEDLAVIPGSPADKAGIVENDIILEINGQKIDETHSLARLIRKYKPGDVVTLKVLHDGKEKTVQVTLEEYKEKS